MSKKKITEAKDIHVSGDFIAGDQYNYYYTGDFASLAEYYISPESVFQRVRTDDFIGRDWLTTKVDAFLNDPNRKSGAFLLIGDAGVGKTSFMAHLVKERRYLHLFAEQAPGQAMLQRAMQSLGSQLVTRYQIDPYKDRDTLNALSVFPDFLERILRLAASKLTEGEKIVIVCDALDEAGIFPDHFVFGLPKELPDGVYFILSQRPVNVKLPNFEPVIERLEAQGEGNLYDMQAYLSAVAKRPEVAGQIRAKEYSEEFFIQTLKEKSQGVWMYLHYIVKEIEGGARAPLDLANLPTGLVGYYSEYWEAWRTGKRGKGEEAWDELYAPLLTTLAAAQEAIPIDWLIQWADVTSKPREVTRLFTEHWRAFITEKDVNGEKGYTPYHLSFKDFITGRVDTTKLPPVQANLVKDLASQTVNAHKRIVNAFEEACNGAWENLVAQDYPRLHLTAHLNGAREYEKLRILLTEGDEKIKWAEAREKKEETYAGYLNDLTYVWEYAEQKTDYGLMIRCMLVESSIYNLSAKISSELLAELGKSGIWSYPRCLATIRHQNNTGLQAASIWRIVSSIPDILLQELLQIAIDFPDESERSSALEALAPRLSIAQLPQALETARAINDVEKCTNAMIALVARLNDRAEQRQILEEILTTMRGIEDESTRINSYVSIYPLLDDDRKNHVIEEMLITVKEIKTEFSQGIVLDKIYRHCITEDQKGKCFSIALALDKNHAFGYAIKFLAPVLIEKHISQALSVVSKIKDEVGVDLALLVVLESLAPFLNGAQQIIYLSLIKESLSEDSSRASALAGLSENLDAAVVPIALGIARELHEASARCTALTVLIPFANNDLRHELILESLSAANDISIEDPTRRAAGFIQTFPFLDYPELFQEIFLAALDAARALESPNERAWTLHILWLHTINEDRRILFDEILSCFIEQEPYPRYELATQLSQAMDEEDQKQFLAFVKNRKAEEHQSILLSCIFPLLRNELQKEAVEIAVRFKDKKLRSDTLTEMSLHLEDGLKKEVLRVALSAVYETKDDFFLCKALTRLAPYLDSQKIEQIFLLAMDIENPSTQVNILGSLAPIAEKELKTRVVEESLAAIRKIQNEYDKQQSLIAIAPHLEEQYLYVLVSIIEEFSESYRMADAFAELFQYMNEEQKERVILKVIEKKDESYFPTFLMRTGKFLSAKQVVEIYKAVLKTDESSKLDSLIYLIPHLQGENRSNAISHVLNAIHSSPESDLQNIFTKIAPYLEDNQKNQVVLFASQISDVEYRFKSLICLIPFLPESIKNENIQAVFSVARSMTNDGDRLKSMAAMLPYLGERTKTEAIDDILTTNQQIKDNQERLEILTSIMPHVSIKNKIEIFQQSLAVIKKTSGNGYYLVTGLGNLLSKLSPELEHLGMDAIFEIKDEKDRSMVFNFTFTYFTKKEIRIQGMKKIIYSLAFMSEILTEWKKIDFEGLESMLPSLIKKASRWNKAVALEVAGDITPALVHFRRPEIADELYRTITDVTRWWP